MWRVLLRIAQLLTLVACRLRVTGDVPDPLRETPLILAMNHIGVFDPVAVASACRRQRLAPRFMAAGGLFRAPIVGAILRASGLIRVDRTSPTVASTLDTARTILVGGDPVATYPEGRIGLDPGMWPERGKTGVARLALATGATVIPVAQWGAHEVMVWNGWTQMALRLARSVITRPIVRVHFGAPVDLSDLAPDTPGAAIIATNRVIDALTTHVASLRVDEPRLPAYIDPTRPLTTARRLRPPPPAD